MHPGTRALLEAGVISTDDCVLYPSGMLMVGYCFTAQLRQGIAAWHMARHGCLTASRLPVWLGFFNNKCALMEKSIRDDSRLAQALADAQKSCADAEGPVSMEPARQFACAWDSNLEPNGLLTLLDAFPDVSGCSLYEHGFQQLDSWPEGFQPGIPVSALSPIGVYLDGLWHADPLGNENASFSPSVIEIKCQFPFKQAIGGLWEVDRFKRPGATVPADHFAQVQLQMLVSGCKQAYLVHYSVTRPSTILRVPFDDQWCQAAVELLSDIWAEPQFIGGSGVGVSS